MAESNHEKLEKAIGKALDKVNASLEQKEAPDFETLETLRVLTNMASLNILRLG